MDKSEINRYLKKSFADITTQISDIYGVDSTERLSDFMAGMLGESHRKPSHPLQKPRLLFFPGLDNGPWIDESSNEATAQVANLLTEHFHAIKEEFTAATSQLKAYSSSNLFKNLSQKDWSSISLWSRGKFSEQIAHFPTIEKLIGKFEDLLFPWRGEVTFMRLKAGAWLPEHYDWTNAQITCHFGINIPDDCGLIVAGEERRWEEGKSIFFDHSFLHHVYNHSASDRDILLINFLHPELTDAEIHGIRLLGPVLAKISDPPQ
ncbi:aspartyl/asparaginyl beta-hydroxylase domain-containing protein [Dickeya undicola]|uniref:Aspartyl/asparaginyl beta-hydroxylase domain-containing protein n=1 Tax=Dickeya undicola TaxID=1577887 RepID=A0A3N0FR95_9GAMM|nr:aspartyl/asparaginyl beta-hydroxylase domain-containing protein [Dickeya undicola]RNM02684.1 aspartyl/asparaginyl beta-hydroxylase domain-containing protein [Dickeya undicola]RNM28521.1 aspartyl/asparaginyl beta-hydroxylase domain-containing protein [Dickeya undicola]